MIYIIEQIEKYLKTIKIRNNKYLALRNVMEYVNPIEI